MSAHTNAAVAVPRGRTTLGQRIDALSTADQRILRRILSDVHRSEEAIRERMHGDPRAPDAMARADVLAKILEIRG